MTVLSTTVRQAVDGLIADAVDFPDAVLILADLIGEFDVGLEMRLRFSSSLPLLWSCCRWGTADALAAAAKCRKLVTTWACGVHAKRCSGYPYGPEWISADDSSDVGPSLREAEGDEKTRRFIRDRGNEGWRSCFSIAHCSRLCLRALFGHDVPADVQAECMAVVESIRETLRNLGTVDLTEKGGVS